MRDYFRSLLQGRYTVQTVADGEQALAAVRARKPDLVLSDVMMPTLDGFSLVRILRADPETQAIPVIMISARAGEDEKIEGTGADDYLVKPFGFRASCSPVCDPISNWLGCAGKLPSVSGSCELMPLHNGHCSRQCSIRCQRALSLRKLPLGQSCSPTVRQRRYCDVQ
jgi:CheY-like chemotaxis protein